MKNNYFVLFIYQSKLKNFYLYDETEEKLYIGVISIGATFERADKSFVFNSYYDFNVMISKRQFNQFSKLNFNDLEKMSFNEIIKTLDLEEWLV
jgi:hypothetical protein